MKKLSLYIQCLLCAGILTGTVSCKKELQAVTPQDQLSVSTVLSDPNAAQTLYYGIYADFRNYNNALFVLGEMRSEIWTDGLFTESGDPNYSIYYNHNISALNAPAGDWAGFYNLLYQVNNVIKLFPKTSLQQAQRDRELAEMYGLRAYIYFTMMKTWGAVPLTIEPVLSLSNASETYKARASADSVLIQIKSDIDKSLTLFNGDNSFGNSSSGNRVYWNRLATLVLKGDVYTWSGTLMNGGATDLNTARQALQEVENLRDPATLDLQANYPDIFDPAKKKNNKEMIFAINYELGQQQQNTFSEFTVNNSQAVTLSFQQSSSPTVASVYPNVVGSNRCGMNQAMLNKLTGGPADQRIPGTFRIMYSNTSPYAVRGIMLTKWIGSSAGTTQVYNNDFPVYRFADVLLLMAEVKTKLGQDPSPEINAIRDRAYGAGAYRFTGGSADQNMQAILEEQLREFIGEGKRWWALRRAGDQWVFRYIDAKYLSAATVSSGKGPTLLLPITTTMLNNDPRLLQTPGY